jgi:arylsulfatase
MSDRPHVLLIFPDQFRADCMGCAGHPVVRTPNIDRIASEGMRFRNAVTASPVCMSARASLISGQYPHQHHMWHNAGSLPANDETMFHHLHDEGYHTAHIGKSHYYPHQGYLPDYEPYMHQRGFDYVHEVAGPRANVVSESHMTDRWRDLGILGAYRDDYRSREPITVRPSPHPWEEFQDSYVGRHAVDYVRELGTDDPTCVFVGFGGPHEPWDPPKPYDTMYDPADMPPWIAPEPLGDWVPPYAREVLTADQQPFVTPEAIPAIRAAYYGKVSLVDHWVGEILKAYEDRGWLDSTLVIFFSDHGEMAGDHGRLYKSVFHHGSVDVPFVVRWPGHVDPGTTSDAFVNTVDVFPTLINLVDHESDHHAGCSLLPLFEGDAQRVRDCVFSEIRGNDNQRTIMARTDAFTYCMDSTGNGYQLFDEVNDHDQRRNLIGHPDFAGTEREMRDRITAFLLSSQEYTQRVPQL